ncbi:MAG: GNAT family N-acetyltransferase [Caldilineaceae bacterium]|nr:GNAT family N-acetyltransferase [Caldilineaceae bacterium]
MPRLTVRPVTAQNWLTALTLDVHDSQRHFTASVERSLARAYIQPYHYNYDPHAIYVGSTMVGFYCFVYRPSDLSHCVLNGFFIDQRYQQRGYGRAFLEHFLAQLRRQSPPYAELLLTVHPENEVAFSLYRAFGFVKTGRMIEAEDEMCLPLGEARASRLT